MNKLQLSKFVQDPEVVKRIKPLRPASTRVFKDPIVVKPKTKHNQIIGDAFDYLFRFELLRRHSEIESGEWVAELAPDCIWSDDYLDQLVLRIVGENAELVDRMELRYRAISEIEAAKEASSIYTVSKAPNKKHLHQLAHHAMVLARLNSVVRALVLDANFEVACPEGQDELVELLEIVPAFLFEKRMGIVLNPSGILIKTGLSGDADLILDDKLIDLKTVMKGEFSAAMHDQLLGYFILFKNADSKSYSGANIRHYGVYFSRHAKYIEFSVDHWLTNPAFPEIENWFINHTCIPTIE
ncbi:hypothetical protein BH11PLA2_BH11PLA2_13610 [soil metagenome]